MLFLAIMAAGMPAEAAVRVPGDKFVRTANYYLRAGTDIGAAETAALATFDLVVLPAEAQVYNRPLFGKLRDLNPNITLLAYMPTKSVNTIWSDSLHAKLTSGINSEWWLLDPSGNRVSVWPGTWALSAPSGWGTYLANFTADEVWATGLWDGIFYDEFSYNISWVNGGNLDVHRDGIKDDPALADIAWKRSMTNLLELTRTRLGTEAVIVTNGDSSAEFQKFTNGRMFENFPTPWEAGGSWSGVMGNYLRLHRAVSGTPAFIVNANTGNSGQDADYRKMRFGLASTLMGDGFYGFDFGDQDHGQLWRYDEYDARLGKPLGSPVNMLEPANRTIKAGVWRRDFQNGAVVVNSTASTQTVALGQELEKLKGAQDPRMNDGSRVATLTLGAEDGVILLKPIDRIIGSAFSNGAFARIFNMEGAKVRNGFFAYEAPFDGQATVALADLNGDGDAEKVVSQKGAVSVYNPQGGLVTTFRPYGAGFAGAASIATGDVDGDGTIEIVTGAGPGVAPEVKTWTAAGALKGKAFMAYDARFRGGVQVAVGDVYGTGKPVIVTGAGPGGGPQVRIFTAAGRVLHPGFFAYDYRFRGGVRVAAGDVNGDGKAEIVTGAGPGGGPHVRVFTGTGRVLGKGFFASDPAERAGIQVALTDVDHDGVMEIAALTTDVFQLSVVE